MKKAFETKILAILPQIIENGPNETTYTSLENIGLNEDEIEEVLDIINQGVGRASLYESGMNPNQFESYLDENVLFKATIDNITNAKVDVKIDTEGLHPKLKKALTSAESKSIDVEQLAIDFKNKSTPDRDDILYDLIDNNYAEVTELIEMALFDDDKMVQIVALQGITKERLKNSTTTLLIQLFEQTEDNTLISNLTTIFEKCSIKEALPSIIKKLESTHLMTIYDCISCLGTLGDTSILDKITPFKEVNKVAQTFDEDGMLRSETGFTVAEIAKKTITKIKENASL